MKNVAIFPYKMGSKSSSFLSQVLDVPQIKHRGSKFKGGKYKTVINWGASELPPEVVKCRILNTLEAVQTAGNKLRFFRRISERDSSINLIPWTDDRAKAQEWGAKSIIVVRTILTGHSGNGIILVEKGQEVPQAPLYTRYVSKDAEFRVHVVKSSDKIIQVVDVQRKIRDPDKEPTTWKIRSHDNGFMFVREGFQTPSAVLEEAKKTLQASGLDFGAVDVIWNAKQAKAYILEVNTAPGLQGRTIETYAEALTKLIQRG